MGKIKTTAERGKYKKEIQTALYKNEEIRDLLLGDTTGMTANGIRSAFKAHVKSHLFIDDTLTDADTYIFYDVRMPRIHSTIKVCSVIMYLICHRSIIENYTKEGYYGDRIDILSQMIEDTLVNHDVSMEFGIGSLNLDSIDIYNSSRFYGCIMTFSVPNFR